MIVSWRYRTWLLSGAWMQVEMTNCKHFFGRTVKDENGIPYDYQQGCMIGLNPYDCGTHCPKFESLSSSPQLKVSTHKFDK